MLTFVLFVLQISYCSLLILSYCVVVPQSTRCYGQIQIYNFCMNLPINVNVCRVRLANKPTLGTKAFDYRDDASIDTTK